MTKKNKPPARLTRAEQAALAKLEAQRLRKNERARERRAEQKKLNEAVYSLIDTAKDKGFIPDQQAMQDAAREELEYQKKAPSYKEIVGILSHSLPWHTRFRNWINSIGTPRDDRRVGSYKAKLADYQRDEA